MFEKNNKLIMLIDGNYFCYRSYYGYPELYLPDRVTHVGAVYGFIKLIKRYYKIYRPKKIVVSWDSETNIRKEMYKGYKSDRKYNEKFNKESFNQQIVILKNILKDMGIYQIYQDGYESDDVMPEFCRKVSKSKDDLNFIIATNDHDLFQVINKRISVLRPLKEGDKLYNEKNFIKEYGITPKQYLQSMYISGCKTDQVPGINGIAEKTAIKIIKAIGDISNLDSVDKIKGISDKRLQEIKESGDKIEFAKSLVTIFKDFKIKVEKGERNLPALKRVFEEYLKFDSFIIDWEEFKDITS